MGTVSCACVRREVWSVVRIKLAVDWHSHTVDVLVVRAAVELGMRCCGLGLVPDGWKEEEKETDGVCRTGLMSDSGELQAGELWIDHVTTDSDTHLVIGFLVVRGAKWSELAAIGSLLPAQMVRCRV